MQTTLNTGTAKRTEDLVPIFIFKTKSEAFELAKLIVEVKPKYLLNLSNDVDSLKNHVKRNVLNNICYIMDNEAIAEVEKDYKLFKKVKIIDLFNF